MEDFDNFWQNDRKITKIYILNGFRARPRRCGIFRFDLIFLFTLRFGVRIFEFRELRRLGRGSPVPTWQVWPLLQILKWKISLFIWIISKLSLLFLMDMAPIKILIKCLLNYFESDSYCFSNGIKRRMLKTVLLENWIEYGKHSNFFNKNNIGMWDFWKMVTRREKFWKPLLIHVIITHITWGIVVNRLSRHLF